MMGYTRLVDGCPVHTMYRYLDVYMHFNVQRLGTNKRCQVIGLYVHSKGKRRACVVVRLSKVCLNDMSPESFPEFQLQLQPQLPLDSTQST